MLSIKHIGLAKVYLTFAGLYSFLRVWL